MTIVPFAGPTGEVWVYEAQLSDGTGTYLLEINNSAQPAAACRPVLEVSEQRHEGYQQELAVVKGLDASQSEPIEDDLNGWDAVLARLFREEKR